jgi:hypothetical protein
MEVDVTLPDSFTLQRVRIKVKVKPARGIKGGVVEQVYNIEDIVSTGT